MGFFFVWSSISFLDLVPKKVNKPTERLCRQSRQEIEPGTSSRLALSAEPLRLVGLSFSGKVAHTYICCAKFVLLCLLCFPQKIYLKILFALYLFPIWQVRILFFTLFFFSFYFIYFFLFSLENTLFFSYFAWKNSYFFLFYCM